ncbi:hypothetical protein ACJMK2_021569 [Sinanodonta woodiana]|uniref:Uncharacterized protein n=1 Tax=Sinanodonta woodiana TaxID=1069815 RepID=A0ABD3TIX9_SINWO
MEGIWTSASRSNPKSKSNQKGGQDLEDLKECNCPLCLKDFKTPRILPCLDTFCEECLLTYITGRRIQNSFACPICKILTESHSKEDISKNFAAIFPLNAIAESLVSTEGKTKPEQYCDRCKVGNDHSSPATSFCIACSEYFCDGCVQSHTSFKALADHKIIQKNDPSIKLASSLKHVLNCTNHPDRVLEQFCRDHNCTCCSICFEKTHKRCLNALTLSSYAQEKLKNSSSHEIPIYLQEVSRQLQSCVDINEKQITLLQEKVKDLPDQIRNMRAKVIELLNVLEKRIVDESETILQEQSKKIHEDNKRCKSLIASIRLSSLILTNATSHGTDIQNYLTQQLIRQKLDKIKEEVLENYTVTRAFDIKLHFHHIFQDLLLLDERKLAELSVKDVSIPISHSSNVANVSSSGRKETDKGKNKTIETKTMKDGISGVEFVTTFGTLYPSDGIKPRYTGAAFLPEGNIFLVDFSNSKCCLYDSDYAFVDAFILPRSPRDATHLEGKRIAVSIPVSKEIEILMIDRGIKSIKTVTTRHQCYGLTSLNSEQLVVSGHNLEAKRHFWAIITTGGKERHYQEIEETVSGSNISHVTVNGAKTCVYVSCAALEAVFSFTLEGQIVYRYKDKDLKHPHGVGVDQQGNMYVLGWGSNNLHQVSPEGVCIRVITSGIPHNPRYICFTESRDMFLITHGRFFSEEVSLYRLKSPVS